MNEVSLKPVIEEGVPAGRLGRPGRMKATMKSICALNI